MGQLEDILKHQNMVRNNIMKSFGAETSEDSLEKSFEDEVNPFEMEAYKSELTKAELDEFEKAKHQDGDMHPNGKWVWRASANGGKGDWRVAKPGGSKATTGGGAAASAPSSGSTGTPNTSSSYFSKLSNSLIEKYSKKKESVSLSDIEEFYEDFLRDRSQEPTRKVYANEAKKTYDAIVANWHKNDDTKKAPKKNDENKKTIDWDDITVTKLEDGGLYTLLDKKRKIITIGSKQYRVDLQNESLTYMNSGVKLKSNAPEMSRFKKLLDANKKDDSESEKSSFESKEADAYDKGDGKVGNYPVPTHTSYPAANLYSRLKNNRHFGFKYGLPEEEIMKKLKDYKGNVKVSYHNNAGTSEIYRIKFL